MNRLASQGFRVFWRGCHEAVRIRGRGRIHGLLERPAPEQSYSRWVDVRGWAQSVAGDPLVVRIALNGRLLKEVPVRIERPEIAERRPDLAKGLPCGFEEVIPLDAHAPRIGVLTATALSTKTPGLRRTLGVSFLHRRGAGDRVLPRSSYQQTWEAVSQNLTDARYSVAGTADDAELDRSGASTATDVVVETALRPSDVVLEIGCGVGRVGVKLAPQCAQWIGCDVSSYMLAHAQRALTGITNARFVQLNGVDLAGVDDASVDVVYCTAVFMHLDEWERYRYVIEAFRVLKPGGRVYYDNFSLLSPEGWRVFEELMRLDPAARPPNISKASTPEELRAYAEHAGFAEIRVRPGSLFVTTLATKPATQPAA
jgi:SAM-dependent methyltransferase